MHGIKIPPQDFPLKMQGGAYARGGVYLRDTMVYTCVQCLFSAFSLGCERMQLPRVNCMLTLFDMNSF